MSENWNQLGQIICYMRMKLSAINVHNSHGLIKIESFELRNYHVSLKQELRGMMVPITLAI